MINETPTVLKYKNSYLIYIFRMLDMARMAPADKLQEIITDEVKFLYHLICVVVYASKREESVTLLVDWCIALGSDLKLDALADMYVVKLNELNLQALNPGKYTLSFATIWDSIHYLCLLGDALVVHRNEFDSVIVAGIIKNLKNVFYNIFIILFCPICAKHYLTVNIFPYEFEKIEVALYRESKGDPIIMVNEENKITSSKNVLVHNNLIYKSMVFHNHVNNYRPIQHNNESLNNFERMDWSTYKLQLGINN
jgi:Baculoviridae FAD-linked sulfhydryl oxidase